MDFVMSYSNKKYNQNSPKRHCLR